MEERRHHWKSPHWNDYCCDDMTCWKGVGQVGVMTDDSHSVHD